MNKKLSVVLKWLFLIVVLVCIYAPIALIIVYSFSAEKDIGGHNGFGDFTFSLYTSLFSNERIMNALVNTLVIGLLSATFATIIGTFTSVGLHYMKRGRKAVNFMSQVTVVNAEIVTAVGFFRFPFFCATSCVFPLKREWCG